MKFQFHKGTIKTARGVHDKEAVGHFNSIKVQLRRSANGNFTCPCVNFNSIKVQLRQGAFLVYDRC